jgi:hypothetical protein
VSQLAFKHQREKVAADRAGPWQAIFRPENNFCAETENFPVNWGTNHSRHSFVFGNKGSGYDDVKTGLCSTFGNPLARSVDLASRTRLLRDQCAGFAREALAMFAK